MLGDKIFDEKDAVVLKGISFDDVSERILVYPYALDGDKIQGVKCNTCGLMRMPLMDNDIISDVYIVYDSKGHEKKVCDVYLMDKEYMVYYNREYIIDYEKKDVTPTDMGHYGDFVPVMDIVECMHKGRKVVDKARRIDARKQEIERFKHSEDTNKPSIHERIDDVSKKRLASFDFFDN